MRRSTCRPILLALSFVSATAAFAACVGDDPKVSSTPAPAGEDGGEAGVGTTDGSVATDGAMGTDGAAPADAGTDTSTPFDVRSLAGLRLWLESTRDLVPEAVGSTGFGSWSDGSGRWDGGGATAPDGGRHVALPYQVNPPSVVSNAFGGRPTVSFVGGNGHLSIDNHDDWRFGLGDFLIVEVAKVTSGSGPLWVLRPQATAGTMENLTPGQFCVAFGLGVNNGCTTPVYTPSTEPHVFVARRKSDLITLRVDGSVRGTRDVDAGPVDIGVNMFTQPYAFIGGSGVTMQVSEVIVIVGLTSDADLMTLEGHLKTKYAIP